MCFFFSELIPHTVHSFSIVQNILHYFYCWGKCNSNICQGKWQPQKCAVDPNVLRVIVVSRSFINWYSHAVCQHAGIQKEGNVSECRSRRVVIYTFLLQQFSNFLLSGEVAWSVSDLARGLFTRWSVKTLATQSVSKEQEWRKKFIVSLWKMHRLFRRSNYILLWMQCKRQVFVYTNTHVEMSWYKMK